MNQSTLNRRDALRVALASSALILISACVSPRRSESELDQAFQNFRDTMDSLADDEAQRSRLLSIADQIERACRQLTQEHDDFIEQFEVTAGDRQADSPSLQALVEGFEQRRTAERNRVLELQDELRVELTKDDWAMAVDALNQTGGAIKRPKVGTA